MKATKFIISGIVGVSLTVACGAQSKVEAEKLKLSPSGSEAGSADATNQVSGAPTNSNSAPGNSAASSLDAVASADHVNAAVVVASSVESKNPSKPAAAAVSSLFSATSESISLTHVQPGEELALDGKPCERSELMSLKAFRSDRKSDILACLPFSGPYLGFEQVNADHFESLENLQWVIVAEGIPFDYIAVHMAKDPEIDAWEFLVVGGNVNLDGRWDGTLTADDQNIFVTYQSLIPRNTGRETNSPAGGYGRFFLLSDLQASGPRTVNVPTSGYNSVNTSDAMGSVSVTLSATEMPKITLNAGGQIKTLKTISVPRVR